MDRLISRAGLLVGLMMIPCATLAQFSTTHLISDQEFLTLQPSIALVAEGRIGDRGGAATFELDIGQDTGGPTQTANYDWTSGAVEPFTFSYDAGTGVATFVLGGETLTYSPVAEFETFFVRTRAVNDGTGVVVQDLFLDGVPVGDVSSASGPDGIDYLVIVDAEPMTGFTLTGNAILSWTGAPPTQSRLAFEIKLATTDTSVATESFSWSELKVDFRN